jgi:hypothetical protein
MIRENEFDDLQLFKKQFDELILAAQKLPKLSNEKDQRKFEEIFELTKTLLINDLDSFFDADNKKDISEVVDSFDSARLILVDMLKRHIENLKDEKENNEKGNFITESFKKGKEALRYLKLNDIDEGLLKINFTQTDNKKADEKLEKFIKLLKESNKIADEYLRKYPLEESKKTVSKVHPVEGKLHKLLGLKPEETIKSKYSSGEDLYKALARKIKDHSKVTGMLAYAANINKEKDVFDAALHYAKKINAKKDD